MSNENEKPVMQEMEDLLYKGLELTGKKCTHVVEYYHERAQKLVEVEKVQRKRLWMDAFDSCGRCFGMTTNERAQLQELAENKYNEKYGTNEH